MEKIEVPGGLTKDKVWCLIAKNQYDAAHAFNKREHAKDALFSARFEYLESLLRKSK